MIFFWNLRPLFCKSSPTRHITYKVTRLLKIEICCQWQSVSPLNFMKNDHRWNIFSSLSSGQQFLTNGFKNFCQKEVVEICLKKKTHPQHKHSVTFVISRNKKFLVVTNQLWQISLLQPNGNDFYDGLNLRSRISSAKYIAR